MAQIAQSPFFEVPVKWFEIPLNPYRHKFAAPVEQPTAVAPTASGGGEQGQVAEERASRTESKAADRDRPGRLLDERA